MYRSHLEDMDSYESEDEGSCVPMFFEVKDIQSMREGPSTIFQTIVQNFYPYSCGRREYKRRSLSECISRIASTSDEAMILVVLENNYEYWSTEEGGGHGKEEDDILAHPTKMDALKKPQQHGMDEGGSGSFH
jgi:hypothetical protein